MQFNSLKPLYLVTVVFVVLGLANAYFIIDSGKEYKGSKEAYARVLNYQERFDHISEILMGSDDEVPPSVVVAELVLGKAKRAYTAAINYAFILIGIVLIYMVMVLFAYSKSRWKFRAFAIGTIAIAMVLLVVGIFFPFLEINAFEENFTVPINTTIMGFSLELDAEFKGTMYFMYQNKSIMEVITLLFKNGSILVGIAILCFSVLFPILKLVLSLGVLYNEQLRNHQTMGFVLRYIGKWSMADVLVAAVILSFFAVESMNDGLMNTSSEFLLGLYFFLFYVVFSLVSVTLMDKALATEQATEH